MVNNVVIFKIYESCFKVVYIRPRQVTFDIL